MASDTLYTDKELFGWIAEGDENAFGILFHRYIPRIQPVILGLVKSDAIAKDLIQDIFLSLWVDRERLTEVNSPQDWIFRITYNKTYNYLEQQETRRRIRLEVAGTSAKAAVANPVEEAVQFAETARLLKQAIRELPPQMQRVYRLSREGGLNSQEIAQELGLSPNTVRNTLVNAGKAIKAHLARNGVTLPLVLILFFV